MALLATLMRDGRPVPADGEVLVHEGPLILCASGLHASKNILDALQYAPGSIICRVEVGGEIIHGYDKLVCSERTILWRASGEQVLRKFARMCEDLTFCTCGMRQTSLCSI
jgi:hypothetical protein